jgi:hypothetical protein
MAKYILNDHHFDDEDPGIDELLAALYEEKLRPLCPCIPDGVPMYLSKIGEDRYIIKRMPNTGADHDAGCDHYVPPCELSGLGEVLGTAIQEDLDKGLTNLKFDFSMKKIGGRAKPEPSDVEHDSVKTDGKKLTLRGVLHYLWEEAGFNKWSPSMAGKRNWFIVRKHLLGAANGKTAKNSGLGSMLYIPEPFHMDQADEIKRRRMDTTKLAATAEKGGRNLMLVIGEVKEIAPSRYGHKIVAKHLPDFHFMIADDVHKRLFKRFENEMALTDAVEESRLIFIATFSIGVTGVASVEEISVMPVTENWIPFDSTYEQSVLTRLASENRRYIKGLRYNLPTKRPLACAILSDTEHPVAIYVVPAGADESYVRDVNEMVEHSKMESLIWRAGDESFPNLPPVFRHEK